MARRVLPIAGIAGGLTAVLIGAIVALRTARLAFRLIELSLRAATFRLHRRCPDCKTRIHWDARLCRHCGFRLRPSPER